ncbi:hypothetical protein [Occallatibacter savannae]|uniref:hypothetical protein n=1 Tax=Occallatibacter savannae TaxID=1002691 RepID=UPI000D68DD5E|nr:hypothetical protein [Occallatibacter savannae]
MPYSFLHANTVDLDSHDWRVAGNSNPGGSWIGFESPTTFSESAVDFLKVESFSENDVAKARIINEEDRRMRLPVWGYVAIPVGAFVLFALFDHFGKLVLARPTVFSISIIIIAVAMRWKLKGPRLVLDNDGFSRRTSHPADSVYSLDSQMDTSSPYHSNRNRGFVRDALGRFRCQKNHEAT